MKSIYCALAIVSLPILPVFAEYSICENTACASAGICAQGCVGYAYGYNLVRLGCNYNAPASCLCNSNNGHSSTMDQDISICPQASACGTDEDATQGLNIFSAYCSMNLIGAAATTTRVNNAYTLSSVSAGLTAIVPQATSTSTDSSSSSTSSSSSSGGNSLSMSDKIAIGCAIGGAVVTIIIAIPTWMSCMKKKRRNAAESELLHAPPQMVPHVYPTPAQQPFFAPPQQQQQYYWQRPNQGLWQSWK